MAGKKNLFRLRRILIVAMMAFSINSFSQSLNKNWEQDLTAMLDKFMTCTSSSGEKYACTSFIGESLHGVYNLRTLYSEKAKSYLPISGFAASLSQGSEWTVIGAALDQKALEQAQADANAKKAVIAVYKTADGIGHIALILPGELKFSGTWGFKVPNSASFVYNDPSKSYVGKGLSYAFARNMIKDITLYVKKY